MIKKKADKVGNKNEIHPFHYIFIMLSSQKLFIIPGLNLVITISSLVNCEVITSMPCCTDAVISGKGELS